MIQLNDIAIAAGDFRLSEINLTIPTGKYGVLMGRTGSGKTTLLEAIAGLAPVTAGQIILGDTDVTAMKPSQRNIGYVPQDGALFNTMSVRDHLSFALTIRKTRPAETNQRVKELAQLLEITHLLERRPFKLSGGERQRVALGRALSFRPSTLLLDEPLSALDEQTRDQICSLLDTIQDHTGVTVLHITHSLAEAERLADFLFRLEGGIVPDTDFQGKVSTAAAATPDTG
ncbi:MAG: ABC transporter ATP-binding protein [Pirellulaceae bacterium]|nr:ABC transporter ATP-binding protein [Pirellulaceae bacterium]